MRRDPLIALREALVGKLQKERQSAAMLIDKPLAKGVPWSPHVFDAVERRGWYCLAEPPESDSWAERMSAAAAGVKGLRLGVCAPTHVIYHEEVLDQIDSLGAAVGRVDLWNGEHASEESVTLTPSAGDLIYEAGLKLSFGYAGKVLDRWLARCHTALAAARKGVTLEVLMGVLLSQVEGFEVSSRGLSNRSQQIDVQVHNRRVTGILGGSEIVIAEAKNWRNPVGTTEYYSVYRKIETRFGRSRLGFFATTDRFTSGVDIERLRDSKGNILVVPLDKETLPAIWRTGNGITANLEKAAISAASG